MILILSEKGDIATNRVIDWLRFYKVAYFRLNLESKKEIVELSINNHGQNVLKIIVDDTELVDLSNIKSCWYRRGDVKLSNFILCYIFMPLS